MKIAGDTLMPNGKTYAIRKYSNWGGGQVDSSLGFFPLHMGDLRQYHYHYSYTLCPPYPPTVHTVSSYHLEQIIGDTILPTGFTYKVVQSNIPLESSRQYLRVDTPTANVYRYVDFPSPGETLVESLRATAGSIFNRAGSPTQCTGADTATLFGQQTIIKHFQISIIPPEFYSLAYGLGRTEYRTFEDDPCEPAADWIYLDLNYAQIDTTHYGTIDNVATQVGMVPLSFTLAQNYPNPFNPTTVIRYDLPTQAHVVLKVFDMLGREVVTLKDDFEQSGKKSIQLDASQLSSGIYFYRLQAGGHIETKKLVLVK